MSNRHQLLEELHLEYRQMVFQICLGFLKGDGDQANDLTQEVFINVWNSLDRFRSEAGYKTWIYRITVNTCLKFIRDHKNKSKISFDQAKLNSVQANTSEEENQHKSLYQAIGSLKEIDRLIIMLVLDGTGYEEIASIIGLKSGNLRVRIHRIKQELKKRLSHAR